MRRHVRLAALALGSATLLLTGAAAMAETITLVGDSQFDEDPPSQDSEVVVLPFR